MRYARGSFRTGIAQAPPARRREESLPAPGRRTARSWFFGLASLAVLGLCLHTALVKQPPNYRVVTEATENLMGGGNPYGAELGLDFFKYSPLAGLLVLPFAALPPEAGLFLFLLVQSALFFWAFQRWSRAAGYPLRASSELRWVALASIALDLAVAIQNAQVNVAIFALMLLGASQYAEGKFVRSGLVLSLATNLKLFPFTLALCLLTDGNGSFWLASFGGLLLWVLVPALVVGLERNFELHDQWMELIFRDEDQESIMLDVGSFLEHHFGMDGDLRGLLALSVGFALGLTCLILFRRGEHRRLHRFLLPMNGLYVLLFSYLSESPTSILAVAGIFLVGAAAVTARSPIHWAGFILALVLVPGFYSDLAPAALQAWARAIHMKTIGYLYLSAVVTFLFVRFRDRSGSMG